MCACKGKSKARPPAYGSGPTPTMDIPAERYIPRPPPPKQEMRRLPMPPVTRTGTQDVPSITVDRFVPPPPPPKMKEPGKGAVRLPPPVMLQPKPTPVQPDPEKPAVVVVRTPQGDVPVILNPTRPWCQDPRIDAELCGAAQVSDFCGKAFSAWLAANPGVDARAFLSTGDGELCANEIAGVIGAANAKTSGAPFVPSAPGVGGLAEPKWNAPLRIVNMPHGGRVWINGREVSGRWEDAALTRWVVLGPAGGGSVVVDNHLGGGRRSAFILLSPYATAQVNYNAMSATASYITPSGALPNYHMWRPSGFGAVWDDATAMAAGAIPQAGGGGTPSYQLVDPLNPSNTVRPTTASDWTLGPSTAAPQPTTPPVDYGRLIAGIGSAAAGVFGGINTAIQNGQQNRLRELELEFARDARAGQLALQRLQIENQAAIAQLGAAGTPAATEAANALQQQNMALQMQLQALNANPPMSTTAKVGIGLLVVGVLGAGAYALTRK